MRPAGITPGSGMPVCASTSSGRPWNTADRWFDRPPGPPAPKKPVSAPDAFARAAMEPERGFPAAITGTLRTTVEAGAGREGPAGRAWQKMLEMSLNAF